MSEVWREVSGFPGYRVSNQGNVESRSGAGGSWRNVKGTRNIKRALHRRLELREGVTRRKVMIHRLVLEAFTGPCPTGMEACHNNGVADDNRLDNLRWDTPRSNNADRNLHGTSNRGSRNGMSKLTEANVASIRMLHRTGELSYAQIAKLFDVGDWIVGDICRGDRWTHLPYPSKTQCPVPDTMASRIRQGLVPVCE